MVSKEYLITGAMLILVTYTFGLSLISQAYPAGQTIKTLSSTGSIQIQTTTGIAVYSNYACTTPLTSVTWGTISPGGNNSVTCFIKNVGSSPTILSLEVTGWNPASLQTSNYLVLDWDYYSQPLAPNAVVEVQLTLTVDPNIEGITTFSFDIVIVGSS